VRRAIETCKWSRYRLARESGVPESVLSRFVTGETALSAKNLDKLCKALSLELRRKRR
jgi:ribosome-binding protein aMBF1 (putative translation factor)